MATPESWENVTPVYGIRYPKPNAPAQKLPDAFQHIGADLESALLQADIPPVTPAPVMVAPTAAARDAYWGVPGTDGDRLALQNRGATTIRLDKGWTERYFAVFGASNPGGALTPGWYPVDTLVTKAAAAGTQSVNTGVDTILTFEGVEVQTGAATLAAGGASLTADISGVYEISAGMRFQTNGTGFRVFDIMIDGLSAARDSRPAVTGTETWITLIHQAHLTAGQTIATRATQNCGTSLLVAAKWVGIKRISGRNA